MIIPMLCVTIFVILVVWFLLPRVARLMIHTPTAISIFVCLSMVQQIGRASCREREEIPGAAELVEKNGVEGDVAPDVDEHHGARLVLGDLALEVLERHAEFFFKQKTAYEIGLGIPAEPLFRSFS